MPWINGKPVVWRMFAIALAGGISVLLLSCGSIDTHRKAFRDDLNRDIGKRIQQTVWGPSTDVHPLDADRVEHRYTFDDMPGCEWAFIVNRSSSIIEGWRYISSTEKCYYRLNLMRPW